MANEPNKIIYSMVRVSKYIDKKPLIENISLSYFYGAKIGVLGLNGAGKSTLLRILAGVDEKFNGETHLAPGHTIGYLEQEPQLEPGKTVREIVEQGVQEYVDLMNEYNEISAKFAEPMTDEEMNRLIEQQGELQEKIDAENLWDLDARIEQAMDALRCPPGDENVDHLSGRRMPARGTVPTAPFQTRYSLARRTDQPPRRRNRGLARTALTALCGHRHCRHARPLFPRQCRRMDTRTRPRQRHTLQRQLLVVARPKRKTAGE